MYAKDLIEILRKLPENTMVCKTSGESGCEDLESVKYFPQFNILYLDHYWMRRSKGFIDMGSGYVLPEIPKGEDYSKYDLRKIRDLAREGKKIVDAKKDGKMHRIQVVWTFAVSEDMCNDFALKVDGEYVSGHRGEGVKSVICDFEWESLGN